MNTKAPTIISIVMVLAIIGILVAALWPQPVKNTNNITPSSVAQPNNNYHKIAATEFKQRIEAETSPQIIDVRTPTEFMEDGHITHAKNIDFNSATFDTEIAQLNKTTTYYVYCHSGNRSAQAITKMLKAGFTSIYELEGGITSWIAGGYPIVKTLPD